MNFEFNRSFNAVKLDSSSLTFEDYGTLYLDIILEDCPDKEIKEIMLQASYDDDAELKAEKIRRGLLEYISQNSWRPRRTRKGTIADLQQRAIQMKSEL